LNADPAGVTLRAVEREGFITPRSFVAASFIVLCVLAVAVLGSGA
jgi:hypothetical protein